MFERFTERARRVIILAQEEAKRLNHSAVGTEHIFLGIIREGEGVASKVLESLNINPERVRAEIESAIGRGKRAPYEEVAFTPQAKKVLELALNEARTLGHNYIGTEHLLLGLIREGEGVTARILEAMGADLERVRSQVRYLLGEESPTPMGSEMCDVNVCPIYFHDPSGIFVDRAGRIYVVDSALHRIVRMDDMRGAGWTTLGTLGAGVNQFSAPSGVFVDAAGRIYVVDTGNHRVVRVGDMAGTEWTTLGTPGTGVNQFSAPSGVFVDVAGRIYVVDTGSHRVVRVDDMTGAGWTALGTSGAEVNQFSAPFGVCVDKASRIYVADSGNRRVIRMDDMTGVGWTPLGSYGRYGQFRFPASVFVDEAGRIYVMDRGNFGIVRVDDMTGTGWTTLGLKSRLPGFYDHLIGNRAGIFVDRAGLIYVAGVTSGRSNGLVVQVTVKG